MNNDTHLVAEFIPQLRSYARALVRRADGADDLVQDCLQRALEKLHLFERGSNMRAWLFTIMHNIHISNARRSNAGPRLLRTEDLEDAQQLVSATKSTHEGADNLRDLEAALASLSDEQREIIHLIGAEELSYGEVARVLDIPIGTVMSRLHRAREQLRAAMYGESKPSVRRVK